MARFDEAYEITLHFEGDYDNDPDDAGGETFKGIARTFHPNWLGWSIIDGIKFLPNFKELLKNNFILDSMVKDFYKKEYWDVNKLDSFSSQLIANEMFDTGVNLGVVRAAKFLQRSLNFLNKNGKVYNDITEDGKIGNNTLDTLTKCIAYRGEEYIFKIFNILQGNHYLECMLKDPIQEKYAYGWLNRVEFLKK